jgi:Zn-dependent peptidase ImmA (M78 family)
MSALSAAEKRAIAVLADFGVSEAPVPVEEIARKLGAQITYESFEGEISGMLYRDQGTAVIGVNSRHAPTRQRFTVAHEIGHFLMHEGQPVFIDRFVRVNWRDGECSREEVQANTFAAELLMPRDLTRTVVERTLYRRRDFTPQEFVGVLAKRFEVSAAAMQYRLINLEILNPYSLAD